MTVPVFSPYSVLSGILGGCEYYVEDHFKIMLSRLTDKFRTYINPLTGSIEGSPNLGNLLKAHALGYQAVEDVCCIIILHSFIASATGYQLDVVGENIGITRETFGTPGDDEFRVCIRSQIKANVSCGVYQDIFGVLEEYLQGETFIRMTQYDPHFLLVETDGEVFSDWGLAKLLRNSISEIANFMAIIGVSAPDAKFVFGFNNTIYNLVPTSGGASSISFDKKDFTSSVLSVSGGSTGIAGTAEFELSATITQAYQINIGDSVYYEGDTTPAADGIYEVLGKTYDESASTLVLQVDLAIVAASFDGTHFGKNISAGSFSGGEIIIVDGTSYFDKRTFDGTSPVDSGTDWVFTVTSAFSSAPDATSVSNIMPYTNNAEYDSFGEVGTQYNVPVQAATISTIDVLQADMSGVVAGDLAGSQVIVVDGTGFFQDRRTTSSGLAAIAGPGWRITVENGFDTVLDATSVINVMVPGGKLGRIITE